MSDYYLVVLAWDSSLDIFLHKCVSNEALNATHFKIDTFKDRKDKDRKSI